MSHRRRRLPLEVHVFRSATTGRWLVRAFTTTERGYRTQALAARAGRREAKRRRVDLVIHGRHGRIRSKDSYGNETPRLDTEQVSYEEVGPTTVAVRALGDSLAAAGNDRGRAVDPDEAGLADAQARVEPVYVTIEGWSESTAGARSWADLPAQAIKYVRWIEELIGCPVALLSTSPEREDTILVQNPFEA